MSQDKVQWRALVNMEVAVEFHEKVRNSLAVWVTISFSRKILHHIIIFNYFNTNMFRAN
jgi:hypothetical protein